MVVAGNGPTLLLLPPVPGCKEAWMAVWGTLSERFRVVTYDLRVRFDGAPSWPVTLQDLSKVADAFAPGACGVVGHSLGGALAQHWALAHPERVSALVLSSSFARVGLNASQVLKRYVEQPVVLAALRWLPERLAGALSLSLARRGAWVLDPCCDDRVMGFVRSCVRGMPVAHAGACVRLAFAHDTRDRLHDLAQPTLLVVGERETGWARQATRQLAALLPDRAVRVSPGVAHLHLLSGARWFADAVIEWMEPRLTELGSRASRSTRRLPRGE